MMETPVKKPDILDCLANLSADEVFTPPQLANQMLDMLPDELWRNPNAKFLDPFTKSGVFLREIVKRLDQGLEQAIPDKDERIRHILGKQVYGIAITRLTALFARRTLYCNKDAKSDLAAIQRLFKDAAGLIAYRSCQHRWANGSCRVCGASEKTFRDGRSDDVENYAYPFLHNEELVKMAEDLRFDLVIGNPPYQMNDGGGTGSSAKPIYNRFVEQAKKLKPRNLVMIIPSRWMTGGKGLDDFRKEMLEDKHISILHDYINAKECFPNINLEGGVCYFKMESTYNGRCRIFTHHTDGNIVEGFRFLNEGASDIVIRDENVISILNKVRDKKEEPFSSLVSKRNPFGIGGDLSKVITEVKTNRRLICRYKNQRQSLYLKGAVQINKNTDLVSQYKLFISKADGAAGQIGNPIPARIIGVPVLGRPNEVCSETFLCVKSKNEKQCKNIMAYMATKFFRFMVGIRKNKNMTSDTYLFAPVQDFSKAWTDVELYKKYNLTKDEIEFIESMIKPMEERK